MFGTMSFQVERGTRNVSKESWVGKVIFRPSREFPLWTCLLQLFITVTENQRKLEGKKSEKEIKSWNPFLHCIHNRTTPTATTTTIFFQVSRGSDLHISNTFACREGLTLVWSQISGLHPFYFVQTKLICILDVNAECSYSLKSEIPIWLWLIQTSNLLLIESSISQCRRQDC